MNAGPVSAPDGAPDDAGHAAVLLDATRADDAAVLDALRDDAGVTVLDALATQRRGLREIADGDAALLDEPPRWAHYPWRRTVVAVLGPRAFRRLRLDRNRNLITLAEQDRLGALRVGVVGLSSGHVIAHTLAAEGLCGELRLADFDELELSNLNRVPASVFDLDVNKATAAARRISELDPYLTVTPWPAGLTDDTVDDFLAGLDVVIEECDSLDIKTLVRLRARARGIPVVMATSDRGLIDVERFDLDPERPIFHGLLGDVDADELRALTSQQKVGRVLRLIDVAGLSGRAAASLLEVGHGLSTWPQLAGDVTLGAGGVAEAVRRIGLGGHLPSGRIRLDAAAAFDAVVEPVMPQADPVMDVADATPSAVGEDLLASIVAAAVRAPSGGNSQPWSIATTGDGVTISVLPELTSTMDVAFRGSAVAVGAAAFNARVAAAASGEVVGQVRYTAPSGSAPLVATVSLVPGSDPDLGRLHAAVLRRETNRHHGPPTALGDHVADALAAAAAREGAGLRLVHARDQLTEAAGILAAADRIRYLTPLLHAEMISELRWPGDDQMDSGIDVRSLELDAGTLVALDLLKRSDVMAELATWQGGQVLGADTSDRVTASSALAVVTISGTDLADYARGGAAVESVWVTAQDLGLSVQPVSPAFLYAVSDDDLAEVSADHAAALAGLRQRFADVAGLHGEVPALILRLSKTRPASVKSRRRSVNEADRL